MNNNETIDKIQDDEIDLKEIFNSICRYKYSIMLITLIFMILSIIFAYTKANIYSASSTIQLMEDKKKGTGSVDFMIQAFDTTGANLDNEIEIIRSRFLAQKAFTYLNLKTRYFTNKNFRKIELYKNSPFVVIPSFLDDLAYGKEFILTPINNETFNLTIKSISMYNPKGLLKTLGVLPLSPTEKINYNKNHKYGQSINTEFFTINIKKTHILTNSKYTFSFMNKMQLYNFYKKNISISQISKATILKLSFNDTSSLRAKEMLDALHKAYMEQELNQKSKEANLTLSFIDKQLNSINTRLKKSETKLENFKEKNQVVGLGEQAIKTTEQLSVYEAKLEEIQTELNILSNLNQYIKTNQDLTGLTIGSVSFADPALGTLVTKLQEEATNKSTLLVDFTNLHPDVEKANQNISRLKKSIKATLQNNLSQLTQRESSMKKIISKFHRSIAILPKQEIELSRLTRHFGIDEKIYSFLLQKKAETAILKSSTISSSRLLDAAIEIKNPIKPKRSLIILVGIITGLIIGLMYALLKEFMNNTIKNADEIERLSSIPIYGIIPNNSKNKIFNLIDEAYRSIRTNLQFLPKHQKSQIIAITSSVSGEGKTTITANLAKIIAQTNKKVAVLDLDLRKASLHNEFNIPNNVGISNYLTFQNTFEDIKSSINDDGTLDVFTTGTLPPNPSELILTEEMTTFIEELKEKYDYIIIDTAPIGLVTDAAIIMNYSDITFMVVRAEYTRKEFIKNLDRLAKEHHQNTFGLILNGVEIGGEYGYGYGSAYGYGYGNEQYYKNR
jgi:capsular exopolysaccharide synthesis family protein